MLTVPYVACFQRSSSTKLYFIYFMLEGREIIMHLYWNSLFHTHLPFDDAMRLNTLGIGFFPLFETLRSEFFYFPFTLHVL